MSTIDDAYRGDRFRAQARALIDQLAAYLDATGRREGPVLPWRPPSELLADWPARFEGGADLGALLGRVLDGSHHLHHPRYVGHQVTAPLPDAALCELLGALLNNSMAVAEMGPVSTAMERALVSWMARLLGLGERADGIFTSGGSAGNLTALCAARQVRAGFDAWRDGSAAGPPLAVLAADQAHYSIQRAAQILGWGEGGCVAVATDERYRMRPDALPGAIARAEAAGRRVIAVVASAGSTATGAFDPIAPIADFCAARGLWLHVDGAHGASAALSPRLRALLDGVERADSVVWDAHKMMLSPALCTALLFRDAASSYAPFAQQASYLFDGAIDPELAWQAPGLRTLECTKRMMALPLYATLAVHGERALGEYVAGTFDLAARFAARIAAAPDFELAVPPQANIVCFRHRAPGAPDLDGLQARIRARLIESGRFYLVQTRLHGELWLRTTLINPRTTDEDLAALLEAIREVA